MTEAAAGGLNAEESPAGRNGVRKLWEDRVGRLLSEAEAVELTGWSRQAFETAVKQQTVLRVIGSDDLAAYPRVGFNDDTPALPLPGLKDVLTEWAAHDPGGWTVVSWLVASQPELCGASPRDALLAGDSGRVRLAARQEVARLQAR